jgi:sugar porter (SP) family MFS transporter
MVDRGQSTSGAGARTLVGWSITVALGGFLFGFDTAVISGAEQQIQELWELGDGLHGFAVAVALYGTVLGAMLGGWPSDRFGRKQTLFWVGVLYLSSAMGSALAPEVGSFVVFRFIGGVGVGVSSVAAPMYISEISPPDKRGKLVGLFQFNVVLGILIAYASNYLLRDVGGDQSWRMMLGVEAVPALLFVLLVARVPRSPRWLVVKRNRIDEAREVLRRTGLAASDIDRSIDEIGKSIVVDRSGERPSLFSRQFRTPVMLAVLIAFFNQVSGINAIIYYAPRILEMAGLGNSAALLSTAGIGLVNLVFTLVGLAAIDRFGRRSLMAVGSFGLIGTLGLVAYAFGAGTPTRVSLLLFVYIAFFALSQGAVIWVFISEVFPNQVRAGGQALGSFTHWILAALIANAFPFVANRLGPETVFTFFCGMMVLQLLFVWRLMPETKGVSLEELEERLLRRQAS